MPTFMAFKNGQKMSEILGSNPDNLKVRALTPTATVPPDSVTVQILLKSDPEYRA